MNNNNYDDDMFYGVFCLTKDMWCVSGEKNTLEGAKKDYKYFTEHFGNKEQQYVIAKHTEKCIADGRPSINCCEPVMATKNELDKLIKALEI